MDEPPQGSNEKNTKKSETGRDGQAQPLNPFREVGSARVRLSDLSKLTFQEGGKPSVDEALILLFTDAARLSDVPNDGGEFLVRERHVSKAIAFQAATLPLGYSRILNDIKVSIGEDALQDVFGDAVQTRQQEILRSQYESIKPSDRDFIESVILDEGISSVLKSIGDRVDLAKYNISKLLFIIFFFSISPHASLTFSTKRPGAKEKALQAFLGQTVGQDAVDVLRDVVRNDFIDLAPAIAAEKVAYQTIGSIRRNFIERSSANSAGTGAERLPLPSVDADDVKSAFSSRVAKRALLDNDPLSRAPDAEAIAALICQREAPLPLAVGLFGNWGAGKSTFMSMIEAAIDRTTQDIAPDLSDDAEPVFVENVVHIWFNAWHYADGNLWASIGTHIFEELGRQARTRRDGDGQTNWLTELQLTHLVHELDSVREAEKTARAREKEILETESLETAHLADLEKQIIEKKAELENTATDALASLLRETTDQLSGDALKKLGLEEAGEVREQALAIYQQSRETGGWIKHFLRSIWLNRRESCWTLLWPAVALILVFVGGAAVEHFLASSPPFQALVADLKALGGTTLAALLLISKNVTAFNARLAPLRERFQDWERKRKDALEAAEQKAVTVRAKLADLVAERDNTRLARDEAIRRRVHLESLKKGERPEELLSHYISARADSQDYRRHLGLVSLMSRDFQRMSRLLTDAASRKDATPKRADGADGDPAQHFPSIDRIVLYIDDLDRCPPKTVVQVLEAVHLLLAYPLFVVVVGVDARWSENALNRYYQDQFGTPDHGFSVWNYLEKIFQIPYHLIPPNAATPSRTTHGTTRATALATTRGTTTSHGTTRATASRGPNGYDRLVQSLIPTVTITDKGSGNGGSGRGNGGKTGGGPRQQTGKGPQGDSLTVLSPYDGPLNVRIGREMGQRVLERITLYDFERSCLEGLGGLIGDSPRATKRVVNLYRLIRSRWPTEALGDFLGGLPVPADADAAARKFAQDKARNAIFPSVMLKLALDAALNKDELKLLFQFAKELSPNNARTPESLLSDWLGLVVSGGDLSTAQEWFNKIDKEDRDRLVTLVVGIVAKVGAFEAALKKTLGNAPPLHRGLTLHGGHPLVAPYAFRRA